MVAITNTSPHGVTADADELSGAQLRSISLLDRIATGIQQVLMQLALITGDQVFEVDKQEE